MLCVQQMVWRDLQVHQQLNVTQISRRQQKIQIFLMVDQQNLPIEAKFGESLRERLGFMVFQNQPRRDTHLIFFHLKMLYALEFENPKTKKTGNATAAIQYTPPPLSPVL